MSSYNAHHTERTKELHGVELASFTRRMIAFGIDLIVAAALFLPVAWFIAKVLVNFGVILDDTKIVFALNLNWYSIAWTVLCFGLTTYMGKGKSIGKWMMGIRVVSTSHATLSLWHCIERALGYGASLLEFGFGFFQYFLHRNKCTVHDRIAETIVIREPRRHRKQ